MRELDNRARRQRHSPAAIRQPVQAIANRSGFSTVAGGIACSFFLHTSVVLAQSLPDSATRLQLYGRLDLSANAVRYVGAPSSHRTSVTSDSSLFGFRGSEDLGDGLLSYFKLESGINLDTGAQTSPTAFFNREAFVGIGHPKFGYVELGEHYGPGVWLSSRIDPFGRQQMGASETLLQGTTNRGYVAILNNSLLYTSPDLGGLRVRAMGSAAEGTVTKAGSLAAEYSQGKFYVGATYDYVDVVGTTVRLPASAVPRSKTYGLGSTYDFSTFKIVAYVQRNHTDLLQDAHGYMAGISIPLGLGQVRASYLASRNPVGNSSQSAVGYTYFLSKRTQVYTTFAHISNSGSSRLGLWPASQDFGATGAPAAGQSENGLQLGIRHYF